MSFADRLRTGELLFGTSITQSSPYWLKLARELELDFVFLDNEHMPFTREELAMLCSAYAALSVSPIVRIPVPDPTLACMALDGGAAGIVAPYVETRGQVQDLVGAVKYAPLKGQVLSHGITEDEWPSASRTYLEQRNRERCAIINIESEPALARLPELISVPGLDAVLIGPHDLSISLGVPEDYDHPRFLESIKTIIESARAQDIGAGMHTWWSVEKTRPWFKAGLNMLIHGSDYAAAKRGLGEDVRMLREG